jgi:ubiquinone/menaquinone biosynthesis C-methylase UbiE
VSVREPTDRCLAPEEARRFYDRLGSRQDWQGFYENPALNALIAHAGFDSAHSVFEFGCGTGAFAARLLQRHLPADARYVGLDISSTMVSLARERLKPWSERARVYQSDGSPRIEESDRSFDRFVSTYVFDLLAPDFMAQLLSEARRLLAPGGRLCLVSLTHGMSRFSRAVCWGWEHVWRLSPGIVGGCHPIELLDYLPSNDWNPVYRATLTSWGISSEVLVASKNVYPATAKSE